MFTLCCTKYFSRCVSDDASLPCDNWYWVNFLHVVCMCTVRPSFVYCLLMALPLLRSGDDDRHFLLLFSLELKRLVYCMMTVVLSFLPSVFVVAIAYMK